MPDTDKLCLFVIKDEHVKRDGKVFTAWLKFVDAEEFEGEIVGPSYWFVDSDEDMYSNVDWIWENDCHKIEKWAYVDDILMI